MIAMLALILAIVALVEILWIYRRVRAWDDEHEKGLK